MQNFGSPPKNAERGDKNEREGDRHGGQRIETQSASMYIFPKKEPKCWNGRMI